MTKSGKFTIVLLNRSGLSWIGLPDRASVDVWLAEHPDTKAIVVASTDVATVEDHT